MYLGKIKPYTFLIHLRWGETYISKELLNKKDKVT
jgi:hypothetical protein